MFKKLLVGVVLGMLVSSYAFADKSHLPNVYGILITCDDYMEEKSYYNFYILGIVSGMNAQRAVAAKGPFLQLGVPATVFFAYVENYCGKNRDTTLFIAVWTLYIDLADFIEIK